MTGGPPPDEPYFQHEAYLGDVPLPGVSHPPEAPVGLHLRLHVHEEAYRNRREVVPLRYPAGTRVYVHARPYVLLPDYRLTLSLSAVEAAGAPGHHVGGRLPAPGVAGVPDRPRVPPPPPAAFAKRRRPAPPASGGGVP